MSLKKKIEIFQTATFAKQIKKLHYNQKSDPDKAIAEIISDPLKGVSKKGDLAGVRIYKGNILNQLILIAYYFDEFEQTIILLALGSHENFYCDLKNKINWKNVERMLSQCLISFESDPR